jgi:hypothetical protein
MSGDDEGLARFLRGATMGALVGAAVAGSAIWRRRVARSSELAADRTRLSLPAPTGAAAAADDPAGSTPRSAERAAPD